MDIVKKMPDKWIKELTSCVSEKGALFLDWYDAENLRDFIKAKDEEIERLRNNQSILITSFRINMMRLCPEYSHEEFDKDIAAMLKEKE